MPKITTPPCRQLIRPVSIKKPTEAGATLTYNSTTKICTYARSDGTVARFNKIKFNEWAAYGNNGLISEIVNPKREKLTFTYEDITYCKTSQTQAVGGVCVAFSTAYRLADIGSS